MFDISDMAEVKIDDDPSRAGRRGDRNIHDVYEFLEELGKGSYGVVSKVRHREHGHTMAVKCIDKKAAGAKGLREVFSEVEILSLLHHPSIVRLDEIYEDNANLWLVMDLVEGGELETELRKHGHFHENVTRRITNHILLAMEYIHGKGIVHRDLKLANMLVSGRFDEGGYCEVKVADFGFSCVVSNESTLTSFCGTTVFMAPEILKDLPYGKPVDMWAVGVITYLLIYGSLPFYSQNEEELVNQICAADYFWKDDSIPIAPSKGLKDFISKLLVPDPTKRLSATEAIHHCWVRGEINDNPYDDLGDTDDEDAKVDGLHHFGRRNPRSRWRRHAHAVFAAHRLVYLKKLTELSPEERSIPALRNFNYLTGSPYEPGNGCVDAAGKLQGVPHKTVLRLLDLVERSKTVESLDLAGNHLSYEAIQAVAKVVSNHPKLTHLDLSHNPISSAGARALLRLARGSKLRGMNLKSTGIASDIMNQIEAALKDIKLAPRKVTGSTRLGSSLKERPTATTAFPGDLFAGVKPSTSKRNGAGSGGSQGTMLPSITPPSCTTTGSTLPRLHRTAAPSSRGPRSTPRTKR